MRVSESRVKDTASGIEFLVTLSFGPIEAGTLASDRNEFENLDMLIKATVDKIRSAVRALR